MRNLFKDIRFWIIFTFILRLIGITNPPIDSHAWREIVVNMVSKNYLEIDSNILFPRLSIFFLDTIKTDGVSPMEFPLLNYLSFIMAKLFGWQEWYSRLINLVVSSFGLYAYFLLIKKRFSQKIAYYSTLVLTFSIWFTFSRKIMPDTFSVSLALIGFYFAHQYFYEKKSHYLNLFLFLIFGTAGILAKIPASYLFSLMIFPLMDKKITSRAKFIFILPSLLFLSFVYWWYFIWCPELIVRFDNRMFFVGQPILRGLREIIQHFGGFLEHFYKFSLSYSGFFIFCIGCYFIFKRRSAYNKRIIIFFLLGFSSFLIFVLKSGYNFVHHNYYIIPFVPFMALIAGSALAKIKNKKILILLLTIYIVDNVAKKQHDFRNSKKELYRLDTSKILDPIIPREALIAINGGPNPSDIYFTNRRGWSLLPEHYTPDLISKLKSRNVQFIVINKVNSTPNFQGIDKIFEDQYFIIYKL